MSTVKSPEKQNRARVWIRRLADRARSTTFAGEKASALVIAKQIASDHGISVEEFQELSSPAVILRVGVRPGREAWRIVLARIFAREHGVRFDWVSETICFVGSRAEVCAAERDYLRAECVITTGVGKPSGTETHPGENEVLKEIYAMVVAEALEMEEARLRQKVMQAPISAFQFGNGISWEQVENLAGDRPTTRAQASAEIVGSPKLNAFRKSIPTWTSGCTST